MKAILGLLSIFIALNAHANVNQLNEYDSKYLIKALMDVGLHPHSSDGSVLMLDVFDCSTKGHNAACRSTYSDATGSSAQKLMGALCDYFYLPFGRAKECRGPSAKIRVSISCSLDLKFRCWGNSL